MVVSAEWRIGRKTIVVSAEWSIGRKGEKVMPVIAELGRQQWQQNWMQVSSRNKKAKRNERRKNTAGEACYLLLATCYFL